eukprot:COSAG05_NODE_4329_length_1565_cov_0.908595_1_plen_241_part_10
MDALLNDELAVVTQAIMAKAGYAAPGAGQQYTLNRHRFDPGAIDVSGTASNRRVSKDLNTANVLREACARLTPKEFGAALKVGEGLAWPAKYHGLVVAMRSKISKKISKKMSKVHASRTPKEKVEISKKISKAHASRTPKEKAESSKKISKAVSLQSAERKHKNFTAADDRRIRQLVKRLGAQWTVIGKAIGKTNSAVKSRWLNSLRPECNFRKISGNWTEEEDELLVSAIATHQTDFVLI